MSAFVTRCLQGAGVLFCLAFWAFVLYFLAMWGWWALLAIPGFAFIAFVLFLASEPKPMRKFRGREW